MKQLFKSLRAYIGSAIATYLAKHDAELMRAIADVEAGRAELFTGDPFAE